ncbi:hypothetical protein DL93DRAFT_2094105 [Clavulina sp. PMI_390]|nr:hypothetical protein DL93DRAFT_2094105 [Clavulina sp. PMI_390]
MVVFLSAFEVLRVLLALLVAPSDTIGGNELGMSGHWEARIESRKADNREQQHPCIRKFLSVGRLRNSHASDAPSLKASEVDQDVPPVPQLAPPIVNEAPSTVNPIAVPESEPKARRWWSASRKPKALPPSTTQASAPPPTTQQNNKATTSQQFNYFIDVLPNELVIAILQWYLEPRDLLAFGQTCRRLRSLSYDVVAWMHAIEGDNAPLFRPRPYPLRYWRSPSSPPTHNHPIHNLQGPSFLNSAHGNSPGAVDLHNSHSASSTAHHQFGSQYHEPIQVETSRTPRERGTWALAARGDCTLHPRQRYLEACRVQSRLAQPRPAVRVAAVVLERCPASQLIAFKMTPGGEMLVIWLKSKIIVQDLRSGRVCNLLIPLDKRPRCSMMALEMFEQEDGTQGLLLAGTFREASKLSVLFLPNSHFAKDGSREVEIGSVIIEHGIRFMGVYLSAHYLIIAEGDDSRREVISTLRIVDLTCGASETIKHLTMGVPHQMEIYKDRFLVIPHNRDGQWRMSTLAIHLPRGRGVNPDAAASNPFPCLFEREHSALAFVPSALYSSQLARANSQLGPDPADYFQHSLHDIVPSSEQHSEPSPDFRFWFFGNLDANSSNDTLINGAVTLEVSAQDLRATMRMASATVPRTSKLPRNPLSTSLSSSPESALASTIPNHPGLHAIEAAALVSIQRAMLLPEGRMKTRSRRDASATTGAGAGTDGTADADARFLRAARTAYTTHCAPGRKRMLSNVWCDVGPAAATTGLTLSEYTHPDDNEAWSPTGGGSSSKLEVLRKPIYLASPASRDRKDSTVHGHERPRSGSSAAAVANGQAQTQARKLDAFFEYGGNNNDPAKSRKERSSSVSSKKQKGKEKATNPPPVPSLTSSSSAAGTQKRTSRSSSYSYHPLLVHQPMQGKHGFVWSEISGAVAVLSSSRISPEARSSTDSDGDSEMYTITVYEF